MIKKITVAIACDASGDFTVDTIPVMGRILQVRFIPGTLDTGGDLVIVGKDTGIPILTLNTHGTSALNKAPRQETHDIVGIASLYAATFQVEDFIYVAERLTVTEDDGGNLGAGTLHIWVG